MNWLISYAVIWLAATVLSAFFTSRCIRYASQLGALDQPENEAHKTHKNATPATGGIAMFFALMLVICSAIVFAYLAKGKLPADFDFIYEGIKSISKTLAVYLLGASAITWLGFADDRKPMRAGKKFLFQFLIAAITAALGPKLTLGISNVFICWLITSFWIMTVINALNFFDNMDGLAAGTCLIATIFLLLIASYREQYFVAMLAAATAGSCSGFLFYNKPPAKIFMGDSGSHLLGYFLAIICILTTFYLPQESPTFTPVLIPLLVLGIPLFDAVMVVLIRIKNKQAFYIGDNRHISHRFNKLGLSRPYAVLLVCLLCFISGAAALTLLWLPPGGVCLVFAQTGAVLAVVSILQFVLPEGKEK